METKIHTNRSIIWLSLTCLAFFILDRILKQLSLAGKIFFYKNYGVAFSFRIPENLFLYFYIFNFLILIIISRRFYLSFKKKDNLRLFACQLIFFGIISNLTDRLRFGFVIDYFNFYFFYNNLSDVMIMMGIIILMFHLFKNPV